MLHKLMPIGQVLALPAVAAAQTPKVSSKPVPHRATRVLGDPVGLDHRPVTPATPAIPATRAIPATPASGGNPAIPATPAKPATPAVPASPSRKPTSPGQSGSHRPSPGARPRAPEGH